MTYFTHINRGVFDATQRRLKRDPTALVGPPVTARRGKSGMGNYGNEFAFNYKAGNQAAPTVYRPDKRLLPPPPPTVRARARGQWLNRMRHSERSLKTTESSARSMCPYAPRTSWRRRAV